MADDPKLREALLAVIAEGEQYADRLAAFATEVRQAGHDEAAERLLKFSRRYRVSVLDLQGRLAALAYVSSGETEP